MRFKGIKITNRQKNELKLYKHAYNYYVNWINNKNKIVKKHQTYNIRTS